MRRPRLLPPFLRAMYGLFGPSLVLEDEVPTNLRPATKAIIENGGRQSALPVAMTLLSYNVKRGERWSDVTSTLLRTVADHRPDVLMLQEAPFELLRTPALAPVISGRSLFFAPFHQVLQPDDNYPYAQYGQLVASAARWRDAKVIELPTVNPSTLGRGHLMKRIALCVELPTREGRTLALVNVHLEPFAPRRLRQHQHRALLEAVDRLESDVTILCGDFNPSFSQRGEPGLRLLEDHGFANARNDRWRVLDTCLARGHREFRSVVALPLPGSDHRPLLVEIAV